MNLETRLSYSKDVNDIANIIIDLLKGRNVLQKAKLVLKNHGFDIDNKESMGELIKKTNSFLASSMAFIYLINKEEKLEYIDEAVIENLFKGLFLARDKSGTISTEDLIIHDKLKIEKLEEKYEQCNFSFLAFIRNAFAHGNYYLDHTKNVIVIENQENKFEMPFTFLIVLASGLFINDNNRVGEDISSQIVFIGKSKPTETFSNYTRLKELLDSYEIAKFTKFIRTDGTVSSHIEAEKIIKNKVYSYNDVTPSLSADERVKRAVSELKKEGVVVEYTLSKLTIDEKEQIINIFKSYIQDILDHVEINTVIMDFLEGMNSKKSRQSLQLAELSRMMYTSFKNKEKLSNISCYEIFTSLDDKTFAIEEYLNFPIFLQNTIILKLFTVFTYNKERVFDHNESHYKNLNINTFDYVYPNVQEIIENEIKSINNQMLEKQKIVKKNSVTTINIDNKRNNLINVMEQKKAEAEKFQKLIKEIEDKKAIIRQDSNAAYVAFEKLNIELTKLEILKTSPNPSLGISNKHFIKHLRNSIAHGNYKFKFNDSPSSISDQRIIFTDIDPLTKDTTFYASIQLVDLINFIDDELYGKLLLGVAEKEKIKLK